MDNARNCSSSAVLGSKQASLRAFAVWPTPTADIEIASNPHATLINLAGGTSACVRSHMASIVNWAMAPGFGFGDATGDVTPKPRGAQFNVSTNPVAELIVALNYKRGIRL